MGPFLLHNTMNAEWYLGMLPDKVWPVVSIWKNIDNLIFMQDGTPPHFALVVSKWLDAYFPGRWLGHRDPHEWPARCPDLTLCNFFLWGWAKEEVYHSKPRTIEELEDQIREVMFNILVEMLRKPMDAISRWLQKLV